MRKVREPYEPDPGHAGEGRTQVHPSRESEVIVRALILAGGDRPDAALLDRRWPGWREADLVIGADGGARHAESLALPLHRIVGDLDSLGADTTRAFEGTGVRVTRHPAEKDATDTELALLDAVDAGATEIAILGAWGGRSDHALGTLSLLGHPRCVGVAVALLDEATRTRLLRAGARLALRGAVGRTISLTPWGGDATVTATGVRWPLAAARLVAGTTRGISNAATEPESLITVHSGTILVSEGGGNA